MPVTPRLIIGAFTSLSFLAIGIFEKLLAHTLVEPIAAHFNELIFRQLDISSITGRMCPNGTLSSFKA